jgi:hypothetical protein
MHAEKHGFLETGVGGFVHLPDLKFPLCARQGLAGFVGFMIAAH